MSYSENSVAHTQPPELFALFPPRNANGNSVPHTLSIPSNGQIYLNEIQGVSTQFKQNNGDISHFKFGFPCGKISSRLAKNAFSEKTVCRIEITQNVKKFPC